ncbi:unnamed protein product [Arabidopsis lyrata]|nr:unnamed protein product [Arabidopsis lyrata]
MPSKNENQAIQALDILKYTRENQVFARRLHIFWV